MIEYYNKPTKIGEFTSNEFSSKRGKIRLRLDFEDRNKVFILNLQNVYYFSNNPCNYISLGLLNNSGILHNNENKTLYQLGSKKILAQARK